MVWLVLLQTQLTLATVNRVTCGRHMTQDNVRQAATTSSQGGEGSRSCLVSQVPAGLCVEGETRAKYWQRDFQAEEVIRKTYWDVFLGKIFPRNGEFVPSLFHICGVREIQINRN